MVVFGWHVGKGVWETQLALFYGVFCGVKPYGVWRSTPHKIVLTGSASPKSMMNLPVYLSWTPSSWYTSRGNFLRHHLPMVCSDYPHYQLLSVGTCLYMVNSRTATAPVRWQQSLDTPKPLGASWKKKAIFLQDSCGEETQQIRGSSNCRHPICVLSHEHASTNTYMSYIHYPYTYTQTIHFVHICTDHIL